MGWRARGPVHTCNPSHATRLAGVARARTTRVAGEATSGRREPGAISTVDRWWWRAAGARDELCTAAARVVATGTPVGPNATL